MAATEVGPRKAASAAGRFGAGMLLCGQLACAHVTNYLDPSLPRYLTSRGDQHDADPAFRIVTFNIEKGLRVRQAIAALAANPALRDADILVLQEMDASGVETIAAALRMNSVYYPASRQPRGGPDWGNAVLSPWPIGETAKVLLPHLSRGTARARIATRARVSLPGGAVRVYAVHLGAALGMGSGKRRDQRGRCSPSAAWSAGVARDVKDASDHRPVWATQSAGTTP